MRDHGKLSMEDIAALTQSDPDEILDELDKLDAEHKLSLYMKLAWHVVEPMRKFIPNWHIDCISDCLTAVSRGDILRLLVNIPPGGMKSLTTDAFWPSWEWGPDNHPELRYVSASYSDQLTIRDNRRCRSIITSPWYQRLWGDRYKLVSDQNAKTRFDNDKMGFKIATSVGGLGAGERGDRFIIDDPHNIKDGESDAKRGEALLWFTETVPTRMSDPSRSAIIVIMQCVHESDVSSLARAQGYTTVCLPMEFEPDRKCFVEVIGFEDPRTEENELLWPEHMTRAVVERDKIAMGEYAVAAQFQQRPAPRGGGMFKLAWWRFYSTDRGIKRPMGCVSHDEVAAVALPGSFDWYVLSVDAAFKAAKTGSRVGMVMVGGKGPFRYILENRTAHLTFSQTIDEILKLTAEYPRCSRILIEDKANGPAIIDVLRQKLAGIIPVQPDGGKESRASAMQPSVQSGHWLLPEGVSWVENFVGEFAVFPSSAKNDQVDAVSQAANFMTSGVDVSRAISLGKW